MLVSECDFQVSRDTGLQGRFCLFRSPETHMLALVRSSFQSLLCVCSLGERQPVVSEVLVFPLDTS